MPNWTGTDPLEGLASFTYGAGSRLTQVTDTADPHRPLTFTYDPLDRLRTETMSLGTVTYTHDAAGRRTSMRVSGRASVTYTYDANARVRTITQTPLDHVTLAYDAANRRTLLTLPNRVSTEYRYDEASRLTAQLYRNTLGPLGGPAVTLGTEWATRPFVCVEANFGLRRYASTGGRGGARCPRASPEVPSSAFHRSGAMCGRPGIGRRQWSRARGGMHAAGHHGWRVVIHSRRKGSVKRYSS